MSVLYLFYSYLQMEFLLQAGSVRTERQFQSRDGSILRLDLLQRGRQFQLGSLHFHHRSQALGLGLVVTCTKLSLLGGELLVQRSELLVVLALIFHIVFLRHGQ